MPTKNDPEIKRLIRDMGDGLVDLTLTAEQLMDSRPELRRYETNMSAFTRYWSRLRRDIV